MPRNSIFLSASKNTERFQWFMWYNVAWEIVTHIGEYLSFKSKKVVKEENNGVVVKIKVRKK